MAARPPAYRDDDAHGLAMAVVAASPGPLLLLDGAFNIVAASRSFTDAFEIEPGTAEGRPLASLAGGAWDMPRLTSLLEATAAGAAHIEAYETEFPSPGRETRCLLIHVQRLTYLDAANPRLLMAVTDVTAARADLKEKEAALRRNLVLLQEVRHRVANSLQIIASVLLHNARKTRSEETRGHLQDAHHRVMSVAAVERQLSVTEDAEVELHSYFTALCESIGASMIGDPDQLSLTVTGAGGVVEARTSVSLGLIVTELVINALKHAFPENRRGVITVNCVVRGPNWALTVCDDGVGMPSDPGHVRKGLGTSIVEALAQQLRAEVTITPGHPGTHVTIAHTPIALVDQDEQPLSKDRAADAA